MPHFRTPEEREEARAAAVEMRSRGMTYRQIGKEIGVNESNAWKLCNDRRYGRPKLQDAPDTVQEPDTAQEPPRAAVRRPVPGRAVPGPVARPCPRCGREMGYIDDGGGFTALSCVHCDLRTGLHRDPADCDRDLLLGEVSRGLGGSSGNGYVFVSLADKIPGHGMGFI